MSDYDSSEAVVEAARWGARGLNKRAALTTYLLCLTETGQKVARQRKITLDKRKNAYSKLQGVVAEGRGDVDGHVDE
jgi:hypothetical protein